MAWTRRFSVGLGHEFPSVLAVVAAYFAGLGLGAWSLDASIARSRRPGMWYAGLEFFVALWGAATVILIPWACRWAPHWIGLDLPAWRQALAAFMIPLICLLPATFAMGSTLTAMDRWIASGAKAKRCLGGLYACNTAGAVVGLMAGTFYLMPACGFRCTALVISALSLVCAVVAFHLAQRTVKSAVVEGDPAVEKASLDIHHGALLIVLGWLGIGYEVLGVRAMSQTLENTVYSFSAALAVFLAGTAAGGLWYQRFGRHYALPMLLPRLLMITSVTVLLGAWALRFIPGLYQACRFAWGDHILSVMAAELTVSGAVFVAPAACMGALFSLLAQSARNRHGGIGRALACNTLGSLLAPPTYGLLIIPLLGLKWSLAIIAMGYVLLLSTTRAWRWVMAGWIALMMLVPGLPAWRKEAARAGEELVNYRPGTLASVAVIEDSSGHRSLKVNNRFRMGGTASANPTRRHAYLPLLWHPQPRRALFLGIGTGITFGAASAHNGLESDGAELIPEVLEDLPYFAPANAWPAGADNLVAADARRYVRVSHRQYDVIVADLFHPARDGAGLLYTLEHFTAIRARLTDRGLFCQWLPLFQLDADVLKIITRTFLEVFPDCRAFLLRFNVDTPVLGLVGYQGSFSYSTEWYQQRVTQDDLRTALKMIPLVNDWQLFGGYIASAPALRNFCEGAPLNTDDRPIVVYAAPAFTFQRGSTPYGRLIDLLDLGPDPLDLLAEPGSHEARAFATELAGYFRARNLYLSGLVIEREGNRAEAVEAYLASLDASAQFTTAYAHCLRMVALQRVEDPLFARQLLEKLAQIRPAQRTARELLLLWFP